MLSAPSVNGYSGDLLSLLNQAGAQIDASNSQGLGVREKLQALQLQQEASAAFASAAAAMPMGGDTSQVLTVPPLAVPSGDRTAQIAAAALGGEFSVLSTDLPPDVASGAAGPASAIAVPVAQAIIDYNLGPRAMGLAGTVLSGYGVVGAAATLNVPGFTVALDQMYANANMAVTGEPTSTLLNQGFRDLGMTPQQANVSELAVGFGAFGGLSATREFVRDTAASLRNLGVPDWNVTLASPSPGTLYSNPLPLQFERIAAEGATNSVGVTGDTVKVFRVEGAGNQRVIIDDAGNVDIPQVLTNKGRGPERNLYLNFGDEARAQQFLDQRLGQFPDNTIKSFEVPKSFLNELRANSVPEAERSLYPDRPVIADPTKASDQFGLAAEQIKKLRQVIVPGSGG